MTSLTSQPPSLEELFLRHYSGAGGRRGGGDAVSSLAGTAALVRLALRRDRVVLPPSSSASPCGGRLRRPPWACTRHGLARRGRRRRQQRDVHARDVRADPRRDVDRCAVHLQMGIMGAVAVAVLALFVVVRHTRTEEETGRLELLGATVVGRQASTAASSWRSAPASWPAPPRRWARSRWGCRLPIAADGRGLRLSRRGLRRRRRRRRAAREERPGRRRPGRRRPRRVVPRARGRRRVGR